MQPMYLSLLLIAVQQATAVTIITAPTDVTTGVHGNVTLICQTSGFDPSKDTVTWTKDVTGRSTETVYQISPSKSNPVYDTTRYLVSGEFNLELLAPEFSDGTVYHCIADIQAESNVVVLGTPVITAISGIEGDLFLVQCTAQFGSPPVNHLTAGQKPRMEVFVDNIFTPTNSSLQQAVDVNDPSQGSLHAMMNYTAAGADHGKALTCRVYTAMPAYEELSQTVIQVQFSIRNLSVMHMRHINDTRSPPDGSTPNPPPPPPPQSPPSSPAPPQFPTQAPSPSSSTEDPIEEAKRKFNQFLREKQEKSRSKRGVEGPYPRAYADHYPHGMYPLSDQPLHPYDIHSADLTPSSWGEKLPAHTKEFNVFGQQHNTFARLYSYDSNSTDEWRGYQMQNSSLNGTIVLPGHKLSCIAEGNPRPDILWEPLSSPVGRAVAGPDLDITAEFLGYNLWVCVASNTVQQLSSQAHYVAFEVVEGAAAHVTYHWHLLLTSLLTLLLHNSLRHMW